MSTVLSRNQESFSPASIRNSVHNPFHGSLYDSTLNSVAAPHFPLAPRKVRPSEPDYLVHDARNWLTVLQIYCDLLRTPGAVASGFERWVEELSSAVERGQQLVLSLLDSMQPASAAAAPSGEIIAGALPPLTEGYVDGRSCPAAASPIANPTRADAAAPSAVGNESLPASSAAPSPLNMAEAIERRMPLFARMAGKNIHVEIDTGGSTTNVLLAESAFERILQNLVANAIDAMPNGGRLRIALRPASRRSVGISSGASRRTSSGKSNSNRPAGKTLLLRVHDTGDGIAPERLACIFDAGVSGKPACADRQAPHGLGLAIVRDLTEHAGGAVRVRSRLGRGSCFEVELPTI